MKPILALSTSWNSHRHRDGYLMLKEMAELGFDYAELSHGIQITLVPGIVRAVNEGVVKISSTHNFCPLPTGVTQPAPNVYEPSAESAQELQQWLRYTRRTIDFAAELKSSVVVCHLGSVRFGWFNPARRVQQYLEKHPNAGRSDDKAYAGVLGRSLAKLRKRMPPYWARVRTSLDDVLGYAREKGVTLGLENREKFEELPLDEDYSAFLGSFAPGSPVGYWHDTGHADIKERMGLLQHRQHLERMAPHTLGFHLHDVSETGRDHQPIGTGHVDFEMVSRFWKPEHLLTLELSPRVAIEDVRTSKERIEALIG